MHLRLMVDVASSLRTHVQKRGDLTKALDSMLDDTDLEKVSLLDITFEHGIEPTVWIISNRNFNKLHRMASQRGCSVNALVNSMIDNATRAGD
jgi:hypothetical protein